MYDRLFTKPNPDDVEEGEDFTANINPNSVQTIIAKGEPSLRETKPLERFQFVRIGYFCTDYDTNENLPVFNLTVNLKDSWAKIQNKN
jgi:glutaminyl-tRNA synthetase